MNITLYSIQLTNHRIISPAPFPAIIRTNDHDDDDDNSSISTECGLFAFNSPKYILWKPYISCPTLCSYIKRGHPPTLLLLLLLLPTTPNDAT